jgi:hypothetical protein
LAFWRGDEHWHFGEEIDIGILEQEGRDWGLAALELDVVKRDNTVKHELRPDLRGLVGMILGLANP